MRVLLAALPLALAGCGAGLDAYVVGDLPAPVEVQPVDGIRFEGVAPDAAPASRELVVRAEADRVPVVDVYLSGDTDAAFSLPDDLPLPTVLQAGGTFTAKVRFAPDAPGEYRGTVVVEVEDDGTVVQVERPLVGTACADCGA